MNLGLFNRMNLKVSQVLSYKLNKAVLPTLFFIYTVQESGENKGMYSEWTSLNLTVQNEEQNGQSVLEKFDLPISKEITLGLVRQLASNLGIAQAPEPSVLTTDKEVSKPYIG